MSEQHSRKTKILYLLDILTKMTDEENGLTLTQIFDNLYLKGISAERKSIYSDIQALKQAGYQIKKKKRGDEVTYHMVSDNLTSSDIYLLSQLLQTTDFITHQQANELVLKLAKLTNVKNENRILSSMLKFINNNKNDLSEKTIKICDAIFNGKKITFAYRGLKYNVSPLVITVVDSVCYLVAGSRSFDDNFDFFDIDELAEITIIDRKAAAPGEIADNPDFDLSLYIRQNLDLKKNQEIAVTLEISEDSIFVFMNEFAEDRFAGKARIEKQETTFLVETTLKLTPKFISYLYKNSDEIKVLSPKCIIKKIERIDKLAKNI